MDWEEKPVEHCRVVLPSNKHTSMLGLLGADFIPPLHSFRNDAQLWVWIIQHRFCFSHFRWKQREHAARFCLPVPAGVADGTFGLGGVASELCDLLQGAGAQLQGESPGRRVVRWTRLHLPPCGPHLMNTWSGHRSYGTVSVNLGSVGEIYALPFCVVVEWQAGSESLLICVDVGVWGPLWRWDWLHSTGRGHAFYAVPSRGVHPRCVPCGPAWTPTPPTSCLCHRSDTCILADSFK